MVGARKPVHVSAMDGARLLAAHKEARVEYSLRGHLPVDRNGTQSALYAAARNAGAV